MGNLGSFMTEFGAIDQDTPELEQIAYLLKLADLKFQSWTYWQFKYFQDITTASSLESLYDAEGNLERPKVKLLTRTYPQAIAGTPLDMVFDNDTGSFNFTYVVNGEAQGNTEIYTNKEYW